MTTNWGDDPTGTPVAVHVDALDGLRGAAVLGVMAFHLAPLDGGNRHGLLGGGWLGVDVFFTLSGYLITSLLLSEARASGAIDLRAFWRRRVRRLQPAALVAVLGITLSALWWSPGGTAAAVRAQALAAVTGLANWQSLWAHRPYAAGLAPSGFEHFWSLAVEEQFYVVWPLLVAALAALVARRRGVELRRVVLGVALAGIGVSWFLLVRFPLQRAYVGTDARMGSILLGAALAAVVPMGRRAVTERGARAARVATWAGLAVTLALWAGAGWPVRAPLGVLLPMQGLATIAALTGLLLAPSSRPSRTLGWAPLARVGRVSYGLYLWHWPVFVVLTPDRLGTGWLLTTVVRLAVVALLTAGSWFLVEHPVRQGLVLPRTRVALPVAMATVLVVGSLGVHALRPAPAWAQANGSLVVRAGPAAAGLPDRRGPIRPHRVLVVGDSIPTSLADAPTGALQTGQGHLLEYLNARGISAAAATISGCPVIDETIVVDGDVRDSCPRIQRQRLPEAMATFHPDLVVWYSRQEAYPVKLADGRLSTSDAALRSRYADRVRWFRERGAQVLFISPGPNGDGFEASAPGGSSRSMTTLDHTIGQVARENPEAVAGVVRMADLLCAHATTGCPDRAPDGTRFRPEDGVHFGPTANDTAAGWLADRIAGVDLSPAALRHP